MKNVVRTVLLSCWFNGLLEKVHSLHMIGSNIALCNIDYYADNNYLLLMVNSECTSVQWNDSEYWSHLLRTLSPVGASNGQRRVYTPYSLYVPVTFLLLLLLMLLKTIIVMTTRAAAAAMRRQALWFVHSS